METDHLFAKGFAQRVDFFAYGYVTGGLLLWWGDLSAMRAGSVKVLDVQRHILARVKNGEATVAE